MEERRFMEAIKEVWFSNNRIYVRLADDTSYNRPLEAFPTLMEASDEERQAYEINRYGDALRWPVLDEDIHISSFLETNEPCSDNEVAAIFNRFPWLNIKEVARQIKVHKSVLLSYIYGMKVPTPERMSLIKNTLHFLGAKLMTA